MEENRVNVEELKRAMAADFERLAEAVAAAMNAAKEGRIIADTEELVRDANATFRERTYAKAIRSCLLLQLSRALRPAGQHTPKSRHGQTTTAFLLRDAINNSQLHLLASQSAPVSVKEKVKNTHKNYPGHLPFRQYGPACPAAFVDDLEGRAGEVVGEQASEGLGEDQDRQDGVEELEHFVLCHRSLPFAFQTKNQI